jgi:hypothetical protein
MALFAACHNFDRVVTEDHGFPPPFFGILDTDTTYGISDNVLSGDLQGVLYLFWRYNTTASGHDHWIVAEVSFGARRVRLCPPQTVSSSAEPHAPKLLRGRH